VKLTSRDKKFIIAGIVVIVVVAASYGVITLFANSSNPLTQVNLRLRQLENQKRTLSQKDSFEKTLEQSNTRYDQVMSRLLPGDRSSEANAEMQSRLMKLADLNGVEITSRNPLQDKKVQDPATKQDILTKVSVRLETNCDLEHLVKFLVAIENAENFLKVEEFNVYSFRGVRRTDNRGGGSGGRGSGGGMPGMTSMPGTPSAGADGRGVLPATSTETRASMTVVGYIMFKSAEKPAEKPAAKLAEKPAARPAAPGR